ncbi:MAG: DUF3187 family protein [Fimbriimonadales bacterium]
MPSPLFACSILATWWFPVQGIGPTAIPEDVGQGPISTRNGRVVALPFMRFVPRADFLSKGQTSLETSIQVINDVRRDPEIMSQPAVLFEDQETQRLSFLYSKGIANNLEASVEVPFLARDGGFMDPIINWWHHTILPPQFRVRDFLPFGQCFVTIPGVGTFQSANGIGDVSVFLRERLNSKLIVAAGLKAPTGNPGGLLGSGGFDGGINLEYRTSINRKLQLDASLGVVGQGHPTVLQHARGLVDQELLAFTYKRNSRDAWIAQWQAESSSTNIGLASNDGPHRMLTFGYERKLSDKERLDLYFSEDHDLVPGVPLLVNIAPDFTIGVKLVRRF